MLERVVAFIIGCATASAASATVLTFEGLTPGTNPNGYGPIGYTVDGVIASSTYDPLVAPGIVSGQQGLQSSGDAFINMDFVVPVDLAGLFITALPYDLTSDPARTADFSGLTAGGATVTASFAYNSVSPTYVRFDSSWNQLVFLRIADDPVNPTYAEFIVDNVYLVPEPQTWAMMLTGFGAIGASLRRTRRKRSFAR